MTYKLIGLLLLFSIICWIYKEYKEYKLLIDLLKLLKEFNKKLEQHGIDKHGEKIHEFMESIRIKIEEINENNV